MKELQELLTKLLAKPENAEPMMNMIRDIAMRYAHHVGDEGADVFYAMKPFSEKKEFFEKFMASWVSDQREIAGEIKDQRDVFNIPNN